MYTIVFAGGGTAGHVMPNLALIEALSNEYNCVYIGSNGMEKDLCAARNIPFYSIETVKLRRDAIFKNAAVPFKLGKCVRSAKKVLSEIRPSLIFSKGGYAALPVVLAAKDTPVLCHESDFTPGIVTKLSKRKSKYVLCAFESCAELFKNGLYCGTPLRRSLYNGKKRDLGFTDNKPVLLIVGGSSGAAVINDCVKQALPRLLKTFNVVHITGKNKQGCSAQRGYRSIEFENDMAGLYASVDIAITRGGANALSELVALKIPAVTVPLEKASRGDQLQNARFLAGKGAIELLKESDMTPTALASCAEETWKNKAKYISAMSKIPIDGTDKICGIIRETLRAKS